MKSSAEQDAIIKPLTRLYADLAEVEMRFQLMVGDHDFRPRIDYFHDAIRAYTSGQGKHREEGGRLSVELLAYDLACLRYLESAPLASFKPHGQAMSAQTGMVAMKPGLVPKAERPDRALREQISELYRHYALLFAALLKPFADRDYRDRLEEMNEDVEQMHNLTHHIEGMIQGKGSAEQLQTAAQHIGDDMLRHELLSFIYQEQHKKRESLRQVAQFLKECIAKKDREIAAIDAAHLNYVMAQLAIFEASKDIMKKMGGQGMNLAGQFVQDAMTKTQNEMGR